MIGRFLIFIFFPQVYLGFVSSSNSSGRRGSLSADQIVSSGNWSSCNRIGL